MTPQQTRRLQTLPALSSFQDVVEAFLGPRTTYKTNSRVNVWKAGGIKTTRRCNPRKQGKKKADRQYTHLKKHLFFPSVLFFRSSLGQQFCFMPFGCGGSREVFEWGEKKNFLTEEKVAAFCASGFYLQRQSSPRRFSFAKYRVLFYSTCSNVHF